MSPFFSTIQRPFQKLWRHARWGATVQAGFIAVTYFVLARACLQSAAFPATGAALWPPSGLLLAALLLSPTDRWPRLLGLLGMANVLANLSVGQSPLLSFGFALTHMLAGFGAALVTRRWVGAAPTFVRFDEVLKFVGGVFLSHALAALLGASVATVGLNAPFGLTWLRWLITSWAGALIIASLLLIAPSLRDRINPPLTLAQWLESGGLLTSFIALSLAVFYQPSDSLLEPVFRLYWVFPLFIWAAVRFGRVGVAILLWILTIVSVGGTIGHTGPFTHASWDMPEQLRAAQIYLILTTLSVLTFAAVLAERKRAQLALQTNETQLKRAQQVAHVGHWQWDTHTNTVMWSDEMKRIFGLDPTQVQGDLAAIIARAIHPDDKAKVDEANLAVLTDQRPAPIEYRVMWPDGTVRWVWAEPGDKVCDSTGNVLQLAGIVQDITERKRVEHQLREAETRYHALFEQLPDGAVLTDLTTLLPLEFNDTACRQLGYTRAEFAQLQITDYEAQESPAETRAHIEQLITTGYGEFETIHRTKNGDRRNILVTVKAVSITGVMASYAIYRDITAPKQTQRLYQDLVETAHDLVWRCDAAGHFTFMNHAWEATLGYRLEEMLGQPFTTFQPPAVVARDAEEFGRHLAGGFVKDYQTIHLHRTGTPVYLSFNAIPLRDNTGNIIGTQGTARDITAQYALETELRKNEARLRQAQTLARMGVWEWDPNTDHTFWNDEMLRIYGITAEAFTGRGEDYLNFTHPEDRQRQRENIERDFAQASELAQTQGVTADTRIDPKEFRIVRPDGSVCWVRGDAVEVVDTTGQPARMLGILLDITDHKLAEAQIRLQATALAAVANGVVITDPTGTIQWVNPAFTALTGYSPAEVVGGNPRLLKSGRHGQAFYQQMWDTLSSGKVWQGEITNRHKDGALYIQATTITPVLNEKGHLAHLVAVQQDMTAHKEAEERLRLSEERYRVVSAITSDYAFAFRVTPDNTYVREWATESFERITGYAATDPVVRHGLGSLVLPEDVPLLQAHTDRSLAGVASTCEVRIHHKLGTLHWLSIHGQPEQDATTGRVTHIYGAVQDITARKQLEAEREQWFLTEQQHRLQAEINAEATLALVAHSEPNAVLDEILRQVQRLLPESATHIMLVEPDEQHLRMGRWAGYSARGGEEFLAKLRQPITTFPLDITVMNTHQPFIIADTQAEPLWVTFSALAWIRSHVSAPLGREHVWGLLRIDSAQPNSFSNATVERLQPLIRAATLALEKAHLLRAMQTEIAERQQAEAALRESEARFRAIFEHGAVGISMKDEHGQFLNVNPAWERMLGYSAAKARELTFKKITLPEDVGLDEALYQGLWAGQRAAYTTEKRLITHAGAIIWARITNSLVYTPQGAPLFQIGMLEDITMRKLAETTLQQRNEELSALNALANLMGHRFDVARLTRDTLAQMVKGLQVTGGWIYLLEEAGPEPYLRLAAEQSPAHTGVTPASPALPFAAALTAHPPLEQHEALAVLVQDLARQTGLAQRDPGPQLLAVPIYMHDKLVGLIAIFQFAPTPPLLHKNQLLATMGYQLGVALENVYLARAATDLEILREADRLRAELIAKVSHELRTPLGLITASATTLLRTDAHFEADLQREFLEDIALEADKLEKIVDNLLDMSRLQRGHMRLKKRPSDLGAVVAQAAHTLRPTSGQHLLVCDLPSAPVEAPVDERRLEQVLRNLVGNAVKYSPAGGRITIHLTQTATEARVAVSDHGLGIPAKDLERIFESFYRVENTETFNIPGAGLGLAICRGIVEAHGGRIWAESEVGVGSTFYFTLPLTG